MTNPPDTLRAAHLDAILDDYCSQSSPTENLIDILTDAMHWCRLNGERFEALLITARMHIEFEGEPRLSASWTRARGDNHSPPQPRFPIGLRPLGNKLLDLSRDLAEFADEHTESLSFEDYAMLTEQETNLMAYANLLSSFNADAFLEDQVREAEELLSWMRGRVKRGPE